MSCLIPPTPAVQAIVSNPLITHKDAVNLLHSLLTPLHASMSPGHARVHIGNTGTHFDSIAAELEGYARSLWGLAPLLATDPENKALKEFGAVWRKGLDNGTNPEHEEFWGWHTDRDQRFVEMAAIGVAIGMARSTFWDPLSPEAKKRVNDWLLKMNNYDFPDNNWRFFCVLVNVGLKRVGAEYSEAAIEEKLTFIETFYGPHGFPSDGPNHIKLAYDYYATSFAIPFYGLIYSRLNPSDTRRAVFFRQKAIENSPYVVKLFSPEGAVIPFGRSMTYRFACSCFWAAVAWDELALPEPFNWGVIKGLLLRSIRWFTQKETVFNRDGTLSIGWAYPTLFMSEDYNSPQSPYWALKSFFVLALPPNHPFWEAEELPYPKEFTNQITPIPHWMQTVIQSGKHTYLLNMGQRTDFGLRQTAAKYGKMAYSAHFGFSVPTGAGGMKEHVADSTLAVSDDGGEIWLVPRVVNKVHCSTEGVLSSVWTPWPDVNIKTWLIPLLGPSHIRVHRITTSGTHYRPIKFSSAGFSIHSHTGPIGSERRLPVLTTLSTCHGRYNTFKYAIVKSRVGVSAIIDLFGMKTNEKGRSNQPVVQDADGNSNLIWPRTVFPTVYGEVGLGEKEIWVAVKIYARPFFQDKEESWIDEFEKESQGLFESVEELKKSYPFIE